MDYSFAEAVDDACEHLLDPARCMDPECIARREREKAPAVAAELSREAVSAALEAAGYTAEAGKPRRKNDPEPSDGFRAYAAAIETAGWETEPGGMGDESPSGWHWIRVRHRRPGEGHDHSWAEDMGEVTALCPDYNPALVGSGVRCPGDEEALSRGE